MDGGGEFDSIVWLLDGVAGAATWSIRLLVYYFTRWLPIGPLFLPIVYAAIQIYVVAVALKYHSIFRQGRVPIIEPTSGFLVALTGQYDPNHHKAFLYNAGANFLAVILAMDFVHRPNFFSLGQDVAFSRTGYVDTHSANIVVRCPKAEVVQLEYRSQQGQQWIAGSVQSLSDTSDFVGTFALDNLESDTRYDYRTNASHSGYFQTAQLHPKRWTMVAGSSMKPGFPYNPLGNSLRVPGLKHLSNFVESRTTEFMLFLGNFIYIDLPQPLGFEDHHYRRAYKQVYASPSWTSTLRNLPFMHMYDDHEIQQDWSDNTTGVFRNAVEPFLNYHGKANPKSTALDRNYYTFRRGDVDFFVMDTRKYRSPSSMPDGPQKTMLGGEQLYDLVAWLETASGLKVVVSNVPFTRNWRGPESEDGWAGYLHEREHVLSSMWDTDGVVIISGGRHEHATTQFPSPDGKTKVIEFSTSPLSQFSASPLDQYFQPPENIYGQIEETDVDVHHHADGTSKFGAFHFDTSCDKEWNVGFELIVDGKQEWTRNVSFPRQG